MVTESNSLTCRCGRQISDKAKFCPHCGFIPNTNHNEHQNPSDIVNDHSTTDGVRKQDEPKEKIDLIDYKNKLGIKSKPKPGISPDSHKSTYTYKDEIEIPELYGYYEETKMNASEEWHLYYDDDADFENEDDDWTKDPQ